MLRRAAVSGAAVGRQGVVTQRRELKTGFCLVTAYAAGAVAGGFVHLRGAPSFLPLSTKGALGGWYPPPADHPELCFGALSGSVASLVTCIALVLQGSHPSPELSLFFGLIVGGAGGLAGRGVAKAYEIRRKYGSL
eukprot:Hpha_TRINITY_DN9481_c0_g1::TRINITY_DN9481_c0_g1_i1::g.139107::m.139107